MKNLLILVGIAMLGVACAGSSDRGAYNLEATSGAPSKADDSLRTFSCPRSIGDCLDMAQEHCGDAGYTRVRRAGDAQSEFAANQRSAYQRQRRSQDEIRRRAAIDDSQRTSMTIRCKEPREEQDAD